MFFSIGSLDLLGLLLLRRDDVFSYTLFRNIVRQEIGWFDVHNADKFNNRLIQDLGMKINRPFDFIYSLSFRYL